MKDPFFFWTYRVKFKIFKSFNRKPSGFDWRLNGIGDIRDVTALIHSHTMCTISTPLGVLLPYSHREGIYGDY